MNGKTFLSSSLIHLQLVRLDWLFRVGKLITKQINSWSMASSFLSLYENWALRTESKGEKSKMKNRWSKSNSFPTNPTAHSTAPKNRLERMLLFAL